MNAVKKQSEQTINWIKTPTIANGAALKNRLANIGGVLPRLFTSPY